MYLRNGALAPLQVLNGKQASEHYTYTLSESLLPFAHLHYGADYIFQQDNALIHTSVLTAEFFVEQQVKLMIWPARSSNSNPTENLWSILAAKVYANGKQYYNVNELTTAVLSEWAGIELETRATSLIQCQNDALISSSCVVTRPIIE